MPQIRCKRVVFFSPCDENSFFSWARSIPVVEDVYGELDEIVISLASAETTDEALRELIALLHRYDIDMGQLSAFETKENSHWFRSPIKFWHQRVFGVSSS